MDRSQNIYDNETFFEEYSKLRDSRFNCNVLEEKPALFALVPELSGKRVLDLGCGYGENCDEFLRRGAAKVTGVDLSEKMLSAAREKYPDVEFIRGDMSDLSFISGRYDAVFSSLAIHYINDLDRLMREIYAILEDGGHLLFSMEHPFNSALAKIVKDEEGRPSGCLIKDYMISGLRPESWLESSVEKYHHTFSQIINAVAGAGFIIEKIVEPTPDPELSKDDPKRELRIEKRRHKPIFLIISARKG